MSPSECLGIGIADGLQSIPDLKLLGARSPVYEPLSRLKIRAKVLHAAILGPLRIGAEKMQFHRAVGASEAQMTRATTKLGTSSLPKALMATASWKSTLTNK